jgi:hypothetical protein
MSDFKEIPRLLTAEESRKLILRFGDPHEQEHSMAERFAIADALEAANKRIAELEVAIQYVKDFWLETPDTTKWGNALPQLFEALAAAKENDV